MRQGTRGSGGGCLVRPSTAPSAGELVSRAAACCRMTECNMVGAALFVLDQASRPHGLMETIWHCGTVPVVPLDLVRCSAPSRGAPLAPWDSRTQHRPPHSALYSGSGPLLWAASFTSPCQIRTGSQHVSTRQYVNTSGWSQGVHRCLLTQSASSPPRFFHCH